MLNTVYEDPRTGETFERCDFLEFLDGLGRIDMLRFRILLCVAQHPNQHASHYAFVLGVDPSALCKVVRSMSRDGYYGRPHMA